MVFAAFVACQSGGAAPEPMPTFDIVKSWTFEDKAVWPATLSSETSYAGITATSMGILIGPIPPAQLPKTATINGKTIDLTTRLQLPKNGNRSTGALKIPMEGPCTLVFACLSSGDSAERELILSNGKKDIFKKFLQFVTMKEANIVFYKYTAEDHASGDGNLYVYTNDLGGAITLYYIGIAK